MQRRKKGGNNKTQPDKQKGNNTIESKNKFKVLQEEEVETEEKEDEEIEGMEVIKEIEDKGVDQVNKGQEVTEESIENREDQ